MRTILVPSAGGVMTVVWRQSSLVASFKWRHRLLHSWRLPILLFHQTLPHIVPTFHSGPTLNPDSLQDLLLRARETVIPRTTTPISSHHISSCIRQNFCNCQNDQTITIMEDRFISGLIPHNTNSEFAP